MPKLVIFDLDNTLINGDSDRNWGIYLSEKKIVGDDFLEKSEKFYNNYYLYMEGQCKQNQKLVGLNYLI